MRMRSLCVLAVFAMVLVSGCGDNDKVVGAADGQGLAIVEGGQLMDHPVGHAKGSMMKGSVGNTYVDLKRKVSRIDNMSQQTGLGGDDADGKHDQWKSQLICVRPFSAI